VQSVLLALYFRNASQQGEAKTMGKTILGFLGSSLIVASLIVALMASAVTAAEHHIPAPSPLHKRKLRSRKRAACLRLVSSFTGL
jgi:NhaP-type Na+/H+ or K+/H+ antiporter